MPREKPSVREAKPAMVQGVGDDRIEADNSLLTEDEWLHNTEENFSKTKNQLDRSLQNDLQSMLTMKKILIIEDSRTTLSMMSAVLKGGGFEVRTAEKGGEGYAQIKDWKPDLILLDVMLPDANGFDLLAQFKSDETCKQIPVLMLTARDNPDDVIKGLQAGASDYLVKHSTMPKILLEKVKKWLA